MANFSPGQNFVAITWWISARTEISASASNTCMKIKSLPMYKLAFQPGLIFRFDYMVFFQIFKIVCPGCMDPSPCYRQFDFKTICFRSWTKISTRSTWLKFQSALKCNGALNEHNPCTMYITPEHNACTCLTPPRQAFQLFAEQTTCISLLHFCTKNTE